MLMLRFFLLEFTNSNKSKVIVWFIINILSYIITPHLLCYDSRVEFQSIWYIMQFHSSKRAGASNLRGMHCRSEIPAPFYFRMRSALT